ncbi:hypothetical protein [Burkholderia sp. Ac-20365]|uniref:hypothetical protein n=1 Tax=Burkholderia sp. Ac-20365 TaxID=2703897 RepID=UPI00197C5728|nr:hypothetical protein [Burkholderia sp. Ac-20365]MBN3761332.1 hypothetical protein [Burkholderia sp. Ac-20365]
MEITRMGSSARSLESVGANSTEVAQVSAPKALTLPQKFPLELTTGEVRDIQARVAAFDIEALSLQDIVTLETKPSDDLNHVLGQFLDQVNEAENPQVFKLVTALNEAVAKEDLGGLADSILNAKPTLWDRARGIFSKKLRARIIDEVYDNLARLAKQRSKTLQDVVVGMENRLQQDAATLVDELHRLESLKDQYRKSFVDFVLGVAFLHNALVKAKTIAPALLASAGNDSMRKQEINDKLAALESVALAREGMMTRLPAEQVVIQQLETAGTSTLQELRTNMGTRFASIRMTLLTIHSAQLVQNVQRLDGANADLERNLQDVRARITKTVVTTAANAPGNNRIRQAQELKKIINDTRELQDAVDASREANREKFATARAMFEEARSEVFELGRRTNPKSPAKL